MSHYHFIGDSRFVVDMFTSQTSPEDIFNYYCHDLACDLMGTRLLQASWVPREFNGECDALAHAAATSGSVTLTTQAKFQHLKPQWIAMLLQLGQLFKTAGK